MLTRFGSSKSRTALLIKWGLILPLVLVLVAAIVIGARYISGKRRLDRLNSEIQSDPFGISIVIEFEPVVPGWIRKRVGDEWCQPLDEIKAIYVPEATDSLMARLRGSFVAKSIVIEADSESSAITDESLKVLGDTGRFERLEISGGQFTRQGLSRLCNCPNLTVLNLDRVELSPDWANAVQRLSALKELSVVKREGQPFTSQDVESVAKHPGLKAVGLGLSLSKYEWVSSTPLLASATGSYWRVASETLNREFVAAISRHRNIDSFSFFCISIENDAFEPFANSSALRRLQVAVMESDFHDNQLSSLSGCANLEFLELSGQTSGPIGVKSLSTLPSLKDLVLDLWLDSDELQELARLQGLRLLRFRCDDFDPSNESEPDIRFLRSLANLEELDLDGTFGTKPGDLDKKLDVLRSLPRLHWLRFQTFATPSNAELLRDLAAGPNVPVGLKVDFLRAVQEIEDQARDPQLTRHTITLSIGNRVWLPEDFEPDPNFD